MLREIGHGADRENAGDRTRHPPVKDEAVNQTGSDPSPEAIRTGDQLADRLAQSCSPRFLFHFPRATRAFVFCKRRTDRTGNATSCHHPADLLRGEAEQE